MPRFFKNGFENEPAILGADAAHIAKSLRMKVGEELTVCDTEGFDYRCRISGVSPDRIALEIIEKLPNATEPSVKAVLFLCMLKGDGNDLVIRQAVEMGVSEIYPVVSARCVSRPCDKAAKGKTERWQKIANEAAGQSGRGILPEVHEPISFAECLKTGEKLDNAVIFYEGGGIPVSSVKVKGGESVGLLIGPEGGFDAAEVEKAKQSGFAVATLGPRILRAVTAPLAALGAVMLLSGNMD